MMPPRRMRCVSRTLVPLAGLIALLAPIPADARMVTEDAEVPVEVADVKGEVVKQSVKVRIYRDDARARSPFMILNHGRSADAEKRRALDLNVLATNARYLAGKGFAVFVPVRVGYGVTGGPDVEDSGPCSTKIYGPAYEAGTVQSLAIIGHARARPFVDPDSGIAMGQSFGGTIAIALAAKGAPGIRAAVNFAGGAGGRPVTHPGAPCRPELIKTLFAGYGATARIPTLWLYSANDRYWGAELPRAWLRAFEARGGKGEFVRLPAHGEDGHSIFTGNAAAWQPALDAFLATVLPAAGPKR